MDGSGQSPSIEARDVSCARGDRILFDGLNLTLASGEAALVTGPNGVGKSSLLRLLAGLLPPAAGSLRIEGRIALADESVALDRQHPLAQALGFWAKLDGRTNGDVAAAVDAVNMAHLANVPVRILSTGQRKRAILARTLASSADIWLLDEPGNGLDDASLDRLGAGMAAHRSNGGIVIAASHQPLILPGAIRLALGK